MISTFFSTRERFSTGAWALAGLIALHACGGRNALAQSNARSPGFLEHQVVTPPLLLREVWQQPPHAGPLNDENRRITQQAVTNPDLELRLYGMDARNIQVTEYTGIPDVWNGLTTSPVALTLRYKNAYLNPTGLTRMRWRTRTENLHVLHPVVKLTDGKLLVGSQDVPEPTEGDGGIGRFHGRFRGVRGDVRRPALVRARSGEGRRKAGSQSPGPEPRGRDRLRRSHARWWTRYCRMLQRLMDRDLRDATQALSGRNTWPSRYEIPQSN